MSFVKNAETHGIDTRTRWCHVLLMSLIMTVLSCDNDSSPTGHGGTIDPVEHPATLIVNAIHEDDESVEGVLVSIQSEYPFNGAIASTDSTYEVQKLTDADGLIILEGLRPGNITITTVKQDAECEYNYVMYEEIKELTADDICFVTFMFPETSATLALEFFAAPHGEKEPVPIADIQLYRTYIPGWPGESEEDGILIFPSVGPSIFMGKTVIDIAREEDFREIALKRFRYINGMITCRTYFSSIPNKPNILTPLQDAELTGTQVHFTGYGFDFEDGDLPDSSLVWISDRDGMLGTGRDVTFDLSLGVHQITLQAWDADVYASVYEPTETSITIAVSHFETDSYFPLPTGGYWMYRFSPLSFIVRNELEETETWILSKMTVTTESYDTRVCYAKWTVEKNDTYRVYEYIRKHRIEHEGSTLMVTSATENLMVSVFPDSIGVPVEELIVATSYTPSYKLLHDFRDPVVEDYTELEVTAQSTITEILNNTEPQTSIENETISIIFDPGSPQSIDSPYGTFEAIPVVSYIGSDEQTMYLAPGVGIVQLDTTMRDVAISGTLHDTNMMSYASKETNTEMVAEPIVLMIDSDDDRLLHIRNIMRMLCPLF